MENSSAPQPMSLLFAPEALLVRKHTVLHGGNLSAFWRNTEAIIFTYICIVEVAFSMYSMLEEKTRTAGIKVGFCRGDVRFCEQTS